MKRKASLSRRIYSKLVEQEEEEFIKERVTVIIPRVRQHVGKNVKSSKFMEIVASVGDIFLHLLSFMESFRDILTLVTASKALIVHFERIIFPESWDDKFQYCLNRLFKCSRGGNIVDIACINNVKASITVISTIESYKREIDTRRRNKDKDLLDDDENTLKSWSIEKLRVIVHTEWIEYAHKYIITPLLSHIDPFLWRKLYEVEEMTRKKANRRKRTSSEMAGALTYTKRVVDERSDEEKRDALYHLLDSHHKSLDLYHGVPFSAIFTLDGEGVRGYTDRDDDSDYEKDEEDEIEENVNERAISLLHVKRFFYMSNDYSKIGPRTNICAVYCRPSPSTKLIKQDSSFLTNEYYLRFVYDNNLPVFFLRAYNEITMKKEYVDTSSLSHGVLHNIYLALLHVKRRERLVVEEEEDEEECYSMQYQ